MEKKKTNQQKMSEFWEQKKAIVRANELPNKQHD